MKKLIFSALFAIPSMLAFHAGAQANQWWDNNGTGAPTSGTWDTTSLNWANSATLTSPGIPFANNNFAAFAGGSTTISTLTITVPGAVTCTGIGDGQPSGAAVTTLTFNGAGPITVPTGALWNIDCGVSGNNIIINTPITGPGGIGQHNSGTLYLYGNNSYSGGTAVTGGQLLYYNNANSFGSGYVTNFGGSAIYLCTNLPTMPANLGNTFYMNISNAIWDFGDGDTTISGPVVVQSAIQIKNNAPGGTTVFSNVLISGAISSPGGVYPIVFETPNFARITLTGPNTYSGQTTLGVSGATTILSVSNINSVANPPQGPFSSLGDPNSAANGTIVMGNVASGFGATLIYTGTGETSDRIISLINTTGNDTIEMDGTGPLVLTSPFSAPGNGSKTLILQGTSTAANTIAGTIPNHTGTSTTSLTKAQAGSWTLSGTNTYTGGTTISAGTLTIGGAGNLGSGSYGGTISDSGTFTYSSTSGQTLSGAISGAGAFNLAAPGTSVTLSSASSGFSGKYTITGGTLAIGSDTNLGADPVSFVPNDITFNGGPAGQIRATGNLTLNANRGITLGANGGCLQAAGSAILTNNGIISGSGQFQAGVNASTGLGVIALNVSEAYTNTTVIAAGTLRLLAASSISNSAGILMSNSPTFDVSAFSPFALSTTNTYTVIGASNTPTTPASILGAAGSQVNFGAQTVNLSIMPAWTNGDASHTALSVLQSTLVLNGNTINVTNASGTTLDVGNYALVLCTNGISVNSPLTLNYIGNLAPNTAASLAVVSNILVLQVLPAMSYANSQFTNQTPYPSQSVVYGTSTINLSGTVVQGTSHPTNGEIVTVTIPNGVTNTTMINDSTGDFSLALPVNTVPVGTYPVSFSYAGNSGENLGPAYDSSTSLTVTKAAVTVTATNQTKIYGQVLGSGAGQMAFTNTALQNGETIGTVSLAFSGSPAGSAANAPTNTYTITASAATGGTFNANNYTITYVTGSLLVNPLPVGEAGTNTYNGNTTIAWNALVITNVVAGDNVTNVSGGSVTLASSAAGLEPISLFSLTLGGTRATNYTTTGATGAVLVNPLPVGLTGTRYYDGTATADFSILSITNIVGTDMVSPASGSVMLASPAVGSEHITSATGLTLGGAQAGNYTVTGAIGSVSVTINSNPANIGFSSANNAMTLSWPIDHTGWTLQAQTNDVSVGINANWANVSGSTTTNQVTVPIDLNNGCVFYRLLYNP